MIDDVPRRNLTKEAEVSDLRCIKALWRAGSAAWAVPADWWAPAVDAMVLALHRGQSVDHACAALGGARARTGVGVAEGLRDLAALYASLGRAEPPLTALCAFASGWAEASFAPMAELTCDDPLSGLATPPYLRTRLAELYREAAAGGLSPGSSHRLVVVSLGVPPADPFVRIADLLRAAEVMRATFPGGDTLALMPPARVAALIRVRLAVRLTALRRSLRGLAAEVVAHRLPETLASAVRLTLPQTPPAPTSRGGGGNGAGGPDLRLSTMSDREKLLDEIKAKGVVHGRVVLSSGKEADYYVDLRRITLDGLAAPLVGRVLLDLTEDLGYEAVGGLTLGADPVATAMLHAAAARGQVLDAFVVRKEGKAHGLQRRIEGPDVAGRRVLAVEDTTTTGGSVLTAVTALREAGAIVVGIATIVHRGGDEKLAAAGLPYRTVFSLADLGLG
ncbi:hypothetical protein Acor_82410 [Acrocarpospora corrugata]|uniref:Orotate phosphoribosyltransferase n=2 Tax=Acrocarpospora corrugata TaxID=35763 RepID=A0A5M3WDM0_9ACTN|nr:hypothetical protein Acor_82410 [Acrocarpospora corrugata]